MYSDTQYGRTVPRVYRKGLERDKAVLWIVEEFAFSLLVFDFGGEVLNGNCSVGQLTTIGFSQQLLNGVSLGKSYVKSGFLSKRISSSQIYIRSDGTYWLCLPPQH